MRILLVEDDETLNKTLAFQLAKEGFTTDTCLDGEDALHFILQHAYDLILLDRMLPSLSGTQILTKIRKKGITTPVILLTALSEVSDRITGLDAGADDYMIKPFAFEELLARIRCICRRPREWNGTGALSFGDISYLQDEKLLKKGTLSCSLSRREGDLLETFLKNPGQTLPRDLLLSRVWGPDAEVEDGNLDNYIHFLRRRLKTVDSRLTLQTVRGIGYRLEQTHV